MPKTDANGYIYLQLLEPKHVHARGVDGKQALHLAVENDDMDYTKKLLDYGASPNAADDNGVTPFHLSCRQYSLQLIRLLLQKGADVSIVDNNSRGPIHHAVMGGYVRTVHYLVEVCGLSLHKTDKNLATLLHIACEKKEIYVFNYLLRHQDVQTCVWMMLQRSNINAIDSAGNSVMHSTARSGWTLACRRFLAMGADQLLHLTNCQGETPLDVAKKAGHADLTKCLEYYSSLRWIKARTDMLFEWYTLLFLPAIFYINSILTASYVKYPGVVMSTVTLVYSAVHSYTARRTIWIGGWLNPITAGLYGWGSLSTLIVIYQYLLNGLFKNHPLLSFVIVTVMSFFCCVYYSLLGTDAGACTMSQMKGGNITSIKDLDGPLSSKRHFCSTCEIIQPKDASHCDICGQCFYKQIRHCCLIQRCITADNVGMYTLFNILSVLITCIFLTLVMNQTDSTLDYEEKWWKLVPLMVGHYLSTVTHVILFAFDWKYIPAHLLRRWQRTKNDYFFI